MNTTRFKWGIFFTASYLIFIAVISKKVGLDFPKSLNELGDALAGIFAPIAFFWLILGYIQQGKQLEQNTKALEQQEQALQLQIDEMRESLKQQKLIVEIQNKELETKFLSVKPYFNLIPIEGELINKVIADRELHYFNMKIKIRNIGLGVAFNIEFSAENQPLNYLRILPENSIEELNLAFHDDRINFDKGILSSKLTVRYFDMYQRQLSQCYRINAIVVDDGFEGDIWEINLIAL